MENSEQCEGQVAFALQEQDLSVWLPYHLAFVSAEQLQQVVVHFGSLRAGLAASEAVWQQAGILRESQLASLLAAEIEQKVVATLAWAEKDANHTILTLADSRYPAKLKQIADPPIVLFVKGQVSLLQDPQIGVVGARNASRSAVQVAESMAAELSQKGITITSGLAAGIDAAAHRGGLKGLGKTIAVMGTGIDRIYPAQNKALAHQIAEEGALVSEFPLGARPAAFHFPMRNRIISGLSEGVLVVEAALKSGSLITARQAMEQGREVFAVPGSIANPYAKGCHQLIKQGAKLVECGADILQELEAHLADALLDSPAQQETAAQNDLFGHHVDDLSSEGNKLLSYIEYEPISLDELVVLSKMPASEIQAQLMMLELSGKIEALSGGRWRRLG